MALRRTQRDVLPLPVGDDLHSLLDRLSGRVPPAGVPIQKVSRADRWLEDGICSLNELGGGGLSYDATSVSEAQRQSVQRMRAQYRFVDGHLDRLDGQQAWRELVADKGGYEPESSGLFSCGSVASFRDGAVKLPAAGAGKVRLDEHLPSALAGSLLSGSGILHGERCEGSSIKPYVDPVLRRGGYDYGRFLQQLLDSGIIAPVSQVASRCGIFLFDERITSCV